MKTMEDLSEGVVNFIHIWLTPEKINVIIQYSLKDV
jgi:hypothetical protein